jgi:hypothetical protein
MSTTMLCPARGGAGRSAFEDPTGACAAVGASWESDDVCCSGSDEV